MSNMNDYELTVEQEISQIRVMSPHIVILGAGASVATFPNGDKNGKRIPLMKDLVEVVGLGKILDQIGVDYKGKNFEDLYSQLFIDEKYSTILEEINNAIDDYFFSLELPPTPTIYDHLLLSLRETDLIATFNWDPFLIQAHLRNQKFTKLPMMSFLHGNVLAGYCTEHKTRGGTGNLCPKCKKRFTQSPLLYPITKKDYSANQFIDGEWRRLKKCLEMAFMVTVFGYSAPKTDTEALSLMKTSWGDVEKRDMEQIEIVSRQHEGETDADFSERLNKAFEI